MKIKIFLFLLFLAAFLLRFYQLDQVPTSLHADEAVFGYNAYSIITTGKDEYGNLPSFVLKGFDDYRPALYLYFVIPSVAVFGLTEMAVRFPTAVFSLATVILFYFLSAKITKNKEVSLYSTLLLTFSFWHLDLSREASEKILSHFLFLLGLFLFFSFLERKNKLVLPLAFLSWFLSTLSYYAPRFFLPIFLPILFYIFRKPLFSKGKALPLGLSFFLLAGVAYFSFFFQGSNTRFKQLNVFNHPELRLVLEEQIREEPVGTNPVITRIFHNKLINYSFGVLRKYGEYYNLRFLLFEGGEPLRVAVPSVGLITFVELPFLLLGIYFLLKEKKSWANLILLWILIGPMPAAFTVDETPSVYRSLVMLPALNLSAAYGFLKIKNRVRVYKKSVFLPLMLVVVGLYFWNISYYLHQYYVHQRFHRPWNRQYGYKQLITAINKYYAGYDKIYVSKTHGSPYIFFLFYLKFDPALYQRLGSPRDYDNRGFDKYIFVSDDCPSHNPNFLTKNRSLFIEKGECVALKNQKLLEVIHREDNSPAFQLVEVKEEEKI